LEYIEGLYKDWQRDPETVSTDWRLFFDGVSFAQNLSTETGLSSKELDVFRLINAYREYGHFEANLNPLAQGPKSFPELSLLNFNLSDADLDQVFSVGGLVGLPGATLRQIMDHLRQAYCGTITVQFSESMPTVRNWFIREFEGQQKPALSREQKRAIYGQLAKTESFEKFIHTRYVGKKRFSVEGADAIIPMLETLLEKGAQGGVEELVLGMAHRGRLNVLANFMGKEADSIFAEFDGVRDEHNKHFDGDVKYHMGHSVDRKTPNGVCHVSMAFNPSHLEAVDPVVMGMTRAKQRRRRDTLERRKVIPVLIHGDAAFASQGVVAETFQMSQLRGYTVGGTIHFVIDNQVGFTTSPDNARSCPYSSDIAKILQTPVILVNGDDVEACVRAAEIALRFRQEFKRDVVVTIVCYRRFGHNEGDEPAFTQPLMYERIKKHPTLYDIYSKQLVGEAVITDDDPERIFKGEIERLQAILDGVRKSPPPMKPLAFSGLWKGLRSGVAADFEKTTATATAPKILKEVGEILTTMPKGFEPHPKLLKLIEGRREMLRGDGAIDWGLAEMLAYGSLMFEGTPVRISGQDCVRGTFSHRHSCWYDVKNGQQYNPLASIRPDDVEFCVYDSPLSEYAVLGFEYGNSSSDPTYLTIWEAQFGDFGNGAQIIIDQFLASAEQKWQRMSGLTLLLPHGYEGQGPEHSSARLERFLQLCAQENMQVCNLTTPAQIFHALRRQVKRDFRKPLVVMSPKSLLRHPKVISPIEEFTKGGFSEVLFDPTVKPAEVTSAILCSGKVYFDLLNKREEIGGGALKNVALIRVEQLYPWPAHQLVPLFEKMKSLKAVVWAQEEPKNMGAWSYAWPQLLETLEKARREIAVHYAGRTGRASPATGSEKVHAAEQSELVRQAFEFAGHGSNSAAEKSGKGKK
jgi:2-oxoglutarate dehydrogenase E1 component